MRKDNTISLGDAMKKFLKEEDLEKTYNEKRLLSMWRDIMGDMIANRTLKMYIKDQILFATITSAPLKHELSNSKEKAIKLINAKMEAEVIRDIRFM